MNKRWIGTAAVAAAAGVAAPAAAQAPSSATVREIVRVVKASKGASPTFNQATIGTGLATGDHLRTGGRSAAGLRFTDRSLLRLGELTEVVVSAGKQETRVLRGQVFADYKRPGTISGGYAVAAVRGTHISYLVDEHRKQALVRCYKGRVFVGAADNPVRAGTTTQVTGSTLVDPVLQGSDLDWSGGEIRFVDGPYRGQVRAISAFDPATGTVTFAPALPAVAGANATSGYLLARRRGRSIIELKDNEGTTVRQGKEPGPAYSVPQEAFAELERNPWFQRLADGEQLLVFPDTEWLQDIKDEEFAEREAILQATTPPPGPQNCNLPGGGLGSGVRPCGFGGRRLQDRLALALADNRPASRASDELQFLVGSAPAEPLSEEEHRQGEFRIEPFALASNHQDAVGTRLRFRGVSGNVYAELGYRYALVDGQSHHQISEGYLLARNRWGDVTAGRQHLFLGPANNTNIGTLLPLETADAFVYESPHNGVYRQQVGYVSDSNVYRHSGTQRGPFLRGQARVGSGRIGYTVIDAANRNDHLGASVDAAQPLIPNVLDAYGEAGRDTRERGVYTAGLYLPILYQRAKIDTFFEYAHREGRQERVSLRLRKELGSGLLVVGFADQDLGRSFFTIGGGVMWSRAFR